MRPSSAAPLGALREVLRSRRLDAFVVPTADAHNSEYVAPCFARRSFLTGFTGSAGTAVVTTDAAAALWTDGRYVAQAKKELDLDAWTLVEDRLATTPSIGSWLVDALPRGSKVGIDPFTISAGGAASLERTLQGGELELVAVDSNPVDEVWGSSRPPLPSAPVFSLPERFSGQSTTSKLEQVREAMTKKGVNVLVVSALDEVMWLCNIRGSDVDFNPVALSFAIVATDTCILCIDESKVPPEVRATLESNGVSIKPYSYASAAIVELGKGGIEGGGGEGDGSSASSVTSTTSAASPTTPSSTAVVPETPTPMPTSSSASGGQVLWMDGSTTPWGLRRVVGDGVRVVEGSSPIVLSKAVKNEVEMEGMRQCHRRDAAALCRFFAWLEACMVQQGGEICAPEVEDAEVDVEGAVRALPEALDMPEKLTEYSVGEVLAAYRGELEHFVSLSFATICGSGPNGAIIHYSAKEETAASITPSDMLLLDSGGQYFDGTTDVTRTHHFGRPSEEEQRAYTRVLQGFVDLADAKFPERTTGHSLDTLARVPLWKEGWDFRHGTGHGVGAFLNVHEGPHGIASRPRPGYSGGLVQGMTVTDEPGFYLDDKFGIRIENVLAVKEAEVPHHFGGKTYCDFENLTLVPIQLHRIAMLDLLQDSQRQWINQYHKICREEILPLLSSEKDKHARSYLLRMTQEI